MISRRRFIQATAAAVLVPVQWMQAETKVLFSNKFKVPPLVQSTRSGADVYFDLNVQSGFSKFSEKFKTPTWGINQPFLGVTLRANKGDRVHIKVKNSLDQTTTLHWHGVKLPAKADGGPHQPIAPNAEWNTEFEVIQPAATLWYHSHQLHATGEQVYQGLAGMFIIDDDASQQLGLPSDYGVDDFPVIIQERDFNADGSFRYLTGIEDETMGKQGGLVLVNGVVNPVLKASKSLIRLRLLNGSNATTYHLSFDDQREFHIIASDGGLLEEPIKAAGFTFATGERLEILVDVSDGRMPVLQHRAMSMDMSDMEMSIWESLLMNIMSLVTDTNEENSVVDVFQIDARQVTPEKVFIPSQLVTHDNTKRKISAKRTFTLEMLTGVESLLGFSDPFTINGQAMDMERINHEVKANTSEIWTIENTTMMAHPFHIHNVQFKILAKHGEIHGHELGYKDTVLVQPGEKVQVLLNFPEFTDADTPYMYHCHILEHEDGGMMGQFVVV
ncbi:TPA: hypothetical protein EYG59_10170 [Candidatus Poribacteria bacterium]|jgi:bilirubin oxidase|nr:hypothetical protein [Candidatus Poribacteria bacterium]